MMRTLADFGTIELQRLCGAYKNEATTMTGRDALMFSEKGELKP